MTIVYYSVKLFDGRVFECAGTKGLFLSFINNVESLDFDGDDYYRSDVREVNIIKEHILR